MASTSKTAQPPRRADLPELPEQIQKIHALLWDELIEEWGFTDGKHLRQYEASLLDSQTVQNRAARRLLCSRTSGLARAWLDVLVQHYFWVWTATRASVGDFKQQLDVIRDRVIDEVRGLWNEPRAWFERVLRPWVVKSLDSRIKEWKTRATEFEIERLYDEAPAVEAVAAGNGGTTASLKDSAVIRRKARAASVAKVISELDTLRPRLFDDEKEYSRLESEYPAFTCFQVAKGRPDLKLKLLSIQGSRQHIRLAQEIVADQYGLSPATIKDEWKDHKPATYQKG